MTAEEGLALAVDVGGTTIKAELVDRAGTVVAAEQRPTPQGHQALETIAEVGRTLLAKQSDAPVVGAGVVVPGLVDREAGIATYSANIGWRDLELVRSLGAAVAGARADRQRRRRRRRGGAQARRGCGHTGPRVHAHRHRDRRVDRLRRSPGDRAPRRDDGDRTRDRAARCPLRVRSRRVPRSRRICGGDRPPLHASERERGHWRPRRRRAAEHGRLARQVWQDAVEALADALDILSLVVSPALVVIGGGLSRAGEELLAPLRAALHQRVTIVHPAEVTASVLGDRGGVIGAALLARDGWAAES